MDTMINSIIHITHTHSTGELYTHLMKYMEMIVNIKIPLTLTKNQNHQYFYKFLLHKFNIFNEKSTMKIYGKTNSTMFLWVWVIRWLWAVNAQYTTHVCLLYSDVNTNCLSESRRRISYYIPCIHRNKIHSTLYIYIRVYRALADWQKFYTHKWIHIQHTVDLNGSFFIYIQLPCMLLHLLLCLSFSPVIESFRW